MSLFAPPREGASLVDVLPYWGFLYKDVVITKNGELLYCAKVTLRATDAAGPEDLDRVSAAWQRMLGGVEPPHRLYVICERRPVDVGLSEAPTGSDIGALVQHKRNSFVRRTLSELDVWVVFCYDAGLARRVGRDQATWFVEYVRRWVSSFRSVPPITRYLREVVERGEREARNAWQTVVELVGDETPLQVVEGADYARLLHRLVNFRTTGWVRGDRVPHYGLSIDLADSVLAFERTHALVDHRLIGLYSLALPPRRLSANALANLYAKSWEFNSVLEWRPLYHEQASSKVRAVQKHHNNLRWSFFSAMNETEGTDLAVEDAGAAATVSQLETAAVELTTEGIPYGEVALSFAVVANTQEELDARGAEINREFVQFDAKIVRERWGQAPVWFQRMMGAARKALPRPVMVSSGLAACMVPAFGARVGHKDCDHLKAPVLAPFRTRWSTLYGYDLFGGGDVGHTLVLGATGSGKSFLLNFLLLQSLQYRPRIVILDLGGSYRWITKLVGGSYLSMQIDSTGAVGGNVGNGLRPFQLPKGERTFTFLTQWVGRILDIGGYDVQGADVNEIRDRIVDIYELPRKDRTLGELAKLLPNRMWAAMARWVNDGQWAQTFDGPPPTEEEIATMNADWQVVDLAGAVNFPDWCGAALFFLFERLRLAMDDDASVARLKLMVVDEGWHFLTDPAVVKYLMEAAKTWRKRNGVLMLATQSVEDVAADPKSKALLQSMPNHLFLANPSFPPAAGDVFDFTPAEFETVKELQPKKEILLHRAGGERAVLCLDVDPESYWLYTSSPTDSARRARAIEKYGLVAGIQRLASGLDEESLAGEASLLLS